MTSSANTKMKQKIQYLLRSRKAMRLFFCLLSLLPLSGWAQDWKIVKGDCTPDLNDGAWITRGQQRRLPVINRNWNPNKTYRQLVVLVSFKDCDFKMPNPQATYDSIFNYKGYNQRNGKGCVAEYFRDQSNGMFNMKFDVYGPIKLDTTACPYSNPDSNTRNYGRTQLREAMRALIAQHPDLPFSTEYDWNGDGSVNQVIYVTAGYAGNQGKKSYGYIWPNTNYFTSLKAPDGTEISCYTVSGELWVNNTSFGIGTICHEFSHSLGLPDIYPTKSNYGYSVLDQWDLMDGGNFTNFGWSPPNYTAMEKYLMGWLDFVDLTEPMSVRDLKPVSEGGDVYRIKHSDLEWLLLENRQQQGWDFGVPGRGLVIYHVFYDLSAWASNAVNNQSKRRFELVHADNMDYDTWYASVEGVYPYQNIPMLNSYVLSTSPYPWQEDSTLMNTELTDSSVPPARMNYPNVAGTELLGKPITNIRMTDDGLVSFDFMGGNMPPEPETFTITYIVDGVIYSTVSYYEGEFVAPEDAPTKEGYTFSGWSEIPKSMPPGDVTVIGTFTVNKYKLIYQIDGDEYKTYEVEYGSTITPEPQPEGDYIRFEWIGVPETMPAHDVTITADFETGIIDLISRKDIKYIYAPNGKRLNKLQKGLNIIRTSDGRVRKILF